MKKISHIILLIVILSVTVMPTAAHGYIIRSIPEDRSTLERPPTRLQYWFSEALEPAFSEINLRDQAGTIIASGGVDEEDNTLLKLRVSTDLPDGAYIVELRPAFASDSHVVASSQVFFVGQTMSDVEGQAASDLPEFMEIIWKTLLYNAMYVLFGAYMLYAYVMVPVWGNHRYPQGLLPPRVMFQFNVIVWAAIIMVAGGNVLALLQQTSVFFNVSIEQVMQDGLWEVVRIGSRAGDMWNARTVFLLVIVACQAASLYYGEKYPQVVRSFWTANAWLAALLIGTQAVNSHAAGALVLPWVAVSIHWLHTLAVAFWVGGILALVWILPTALEPYAGEQRWQALAPLMRRFSRYTVGAVALVITTGIYNATNWFFTPADVATTYGQSLALKLVLVAALLGVGAVHHIALRPHWLRYVPFKGVIERAKAFTASLRLEAIVVVLAIAASGLLSATPIPEPEFLQQAIDTPLQTVRVEDYEIQLSVIPGGTGVNTYDVVVRQDGDLISNVAVSLQFVSPQRGIRREAHQAEPVDAGLFVAAGDDLDRTGLWWTLVDIRAEDGDWIRAAYEWHITDEAALLQSRPPSLLNALALVGVLAALGYVLMPSARRFARRVDWSPLNIVVATGATVVSAGLLVGSIWFVQQQQLATERLQNPPPEQVNSVLPTAESLARGAAGYAEQCAAVWEPHDDFAVFVGQLDTLSDETLYAALGRGWRDLPPCDGDSTPMARWDIVNYVRTLQPQR